MVVISKTRKPRNLERCISVNLFVLEAELAIVIRTNAIRVKVVPQGDDEAGFVGSSCARNAASDVELRVRTHVQTSHAPVSEREELDGALRSAREGRRITP
jgi:hypothetical protein